MYHKIGTLLPSPGTRPRYIQMFIYDTEHEIENRLLENNGLDRGLVDKIKHILDAHNPFVQTLRQLAQRDDNLIAIMILCNIPCYPYGTYGWDSDCRTVDGTRVTCCDYYAYMLQIETQKLRFIRTHQQDFRAELYQGLQDCLNAGEDDAGNVGRRTILPSSFVGSPRDMYQRYQEQYENDKLNTPDDYDHIVRAEIPDKNDEPMLYEAVMRHMIHVNNLHYPTFKQAFEKRGFLEEDDSIRQCLTEARAVRIPSALRRLLHEINSILLQHKRSLKEFDLPQIAEDYQDFRSISSLIEDELSVPIPLDDLNVALHQSNYRVVADSKLKIPIKLDSSSRCNFSKQSEVCQLLDRGTTIIWDEAPMTDKKAIETVDRTLREMFGVDLPFGENIRPQNDQRFSNFLLRIGNGEEPTVEDNMIRIPDSMAIPFEGEHSIHQLIESTFPDLGSHTYDPECKMARAIITPLNDDVNKLNERVLQAFTGEEEVTYYSFDFVFEDLNNLYLPEFLNSLSPGNLPPHKLTLKKGPPIMLLRNIDPKIGLCNGTRLIYRRFGRNIIDAEILTGQFKRTRVFLPRIPLKTSEDAQMPFEMIQRQFPVRLSFALTINKSQRQTIPNVGIYLPETFFSHGQLYVALSRGV
ncbi:UNVERIFIED_CONTAM: hypothetical protein Scaly_1657100 [Sesamum calycinum]|uniref:ATP-dependent DNA helicase n=1 Tax=Sesamum calycinum TaxID=2727403 RepID=A0AAW2NT93_9LAMI